MTRLSFTDTTSTLIRVLQQVGHIQVSVYRFRLILDAPLLVCIQSW